MSYNFAILRTQKLKAAVAVRRSLKHAFREQDTPNADPQRRDQNSHFGASNVDEAMAKFNALMPEKVRKNGVRCIEYLITASPAAMKCRSRADQDGYFQDALTWLKERHGDDCVFYAGIHRDETTPHMYAYVVPLDERKKLNCRHFLGGADALRTMQTDFADRVGKRHGLERGIEGSKATHTTIRQYYSKLNQAVEDIPPLVVNSEFLDNKLLEKSFWNGDKYETDAERTQRVQNAINQHLHKVIAPLKVEAMHGRERAFEASRRTKEAAAAQALAQRLERGFGMLRYAPEDEFIALCKKAEINQERQRRIDQIPSQVKRATGAALSFFQHALEFIKTRSGSWQQVERNAIVEAIGNKQPFDEILKAIRENSPIRVTREEKIDTDEYIKEIWNSHEVQGRAYKKGKSNGFTM